MDGANREIEPTSKRIYIPQRKIAKTLELALISAINHTEVEKKLKDMVNKAEDEHSFILGVMQQLASTSEHIIEAMIPYIVEGIERKDVSLIQDAVNLCLEYVEPMKNAAVDSQSRCHTFKQQLIMLRGDIEQNKRDVKKEMETLEIDIRNQTRLIEEAMSFQNELEEEKKELQEELRQLKIQNKEDLRSAERAAKKAMKAVAEPNKLDWAFGASSLVATFFVGPVVLIGAAGYSGVRGLQTASNVFATVKSNNACMMEYLKFKTQLEQQKNAELKEAKGKVFENKQEKRLLDAKTTEIIYRRDALAAVGTLDDTLAFAGELGSSCVYLAVFFSKLDANLRKMKMQFLTGQRMITDETRIGLMQGACEKAKQEWKQILAICTQYERIADAELRTNYAFLSTKFSAMTSETLKARQEELRLSIKNDEKELLNTQ